MLACGQKLHGTYLGYWGSSVLEARWGSFNLVFAAGDIESILRPGDTADTLEVNLADGTTFAGLVHDQNERSRISSTFGELLFPWSDVYLIERSRPRIPTPEYPAPTPEPYWRIRTTDGKELSGISVSLSGEADPFASISISDLDELSEAKLASPGSLTLTLPSGRALEVTSGHLNGYISGTTVHFSVAITEVVKLARDGGPAGIPTMSAPQGILSLSDGDTWTVANLEFIGGEPEHDSYGDDPPEIEKALRIDAPLVQYWVSDESWPRGYGFSCNEPQVSLSCPGATHCITGTISEDVKVQFMHGPAQLTIPMERVRGYASTAVSPGQPVTLTWSILATSQERTSGEIGVAELEFARSPSTAYVGWYSISPFVWIRSPALIVTGTIGEGLEVSFDRLTRIEFPGGCNNANCDVHLLYTDGTTLGASLYPGPTNEDTQHGPASWTVSQEGLLARLSEGCWSSSPLTVLFR